MEQEWWKELPPGPVAVDSESELDDRFEWADVTSMGDLPKRSYIATRIRRTD